MRGAGHAGAGWSGPGVLRGKVRAALAGANSFTEFSERLSLDGVLVRPRMSVLDPEEVTGYAVALRGSAVDAADGFEPVWFGGRKLAPDLTLPQLKARWCREDTATREPAEARQRPPRLVPEQPAMRSTRLNARRCGRPPTRPSAGPTSSYEPPPVATRRRGRWRRLLRSPRVSSWPLSGA